MTKYETDLEKRPLTESEKTFSEENYNLFLWYVRFYKLNEEESDALIIPYLEVVKKYLSIPRLRQYKFSTILVRQMNAYRQRYYRNMRSGKNMPEGGFCSLDYIIRNLDGREERIESYWIDKSVDIEKYFIDQEVFKEFLDIIDRFSIGEQMKVILHLLLEKYTEREIIKYIYKNFPEWEFDRKKLNFILQHLRFAFIEAGLNTVCSKTSICQVAYYDVLEYAVKERIIKRQGVKFLYNGEVIGKGRDEGKTYLEEHPMELSEIMDKMKLKYLCAG